MKKKLQKYRDEILYFFKNAPLAILTSSLPGFVNYAVILTLAAMHSMEDVGQYRLLMSYFALMGIFSFKESSKIQIRAQASGDQKTSAALFFTRLYGIGLATLFIVGLWVFELMSGQSILPEGLFAVALLSCLIYPTDLFLSYLQGEKKFPLLAGISFLKYIFALAAFIILIFFGESVGVATIAQIMAMAVSNIVFSCMWLGSILTEHARSVFNPVKLMRNTNVREASTLSLANWLPGTLEHIDKMIIGYFFGLETLGLYTLAFSTGRFIYNALKPAFYIYYRHFVDTLPSKKLLNLVMTSFTLFGVCLSAAFLAGMHYLPFFAKFRGGETVVYILFLSYGIAMVDSIYTQSYGINKETESHHLLISNTIISLVCIIMFLFCFIVSASTALVVCAMHYPVRHAGTIFMLSWLKKREQNSVL